MVLAIGVTLPELFDLIGSLCEAARKSHTNAMIYREMSDIANLANIYQVGAAIENDSRSAVIRTD